MVSEPTLVGPKSIASANKMFRLKYSCEEVYERMEKGLCIFCDELDIPGHNQLKHKGIQIFMTECLDDKVSEDEEEAHQGTVKNPEPFIEIMTNVEPETMKKPDPFIEPLKHASALQVPDSVYDVLLFHQMDSLVKEVGELPQQSTSDKYEKVAHQLFDEMPSKEKRIKHMKGWRFKFKPTSKRSILMDDKFSFVEATDLLNKDPQEIIWDCVNKEFKETMAGCGNKITDRFKLVVETLKPAVYDGTIQIRVWDCGGSPLEYGDESPDDAKPDEVTVEGISNKPVNMIQDGESNSNNESRSEVSVSQFQVPILSLEPSQFDVTTIADAVWIAKRCESSLLQRLSATKSRAPFSPYQNYNNQPYYERKFGKCPEIEVDRKSDEIKDEKLQDKQPEEDVKTLVISENEQFLECDDEESFDVREPSEVTVEEIVDKSVDMIREDISTPENESSLEVMPQILLSQLRIFDDELQGILGDHTLVPMKPYQSYSQSWYELDTILSDINYKVLVAHECDMVGVVVIYEVATTFEKLGKTWKFKFKSNPERSKLLDDMFSIMEKSSEKYVMVRESHHRLLESQQGNGLSLLNCLIAHDVLRLSSSEYTKHPLILVYHLCSLSSSGLFMKTYAGCLVALLMVYDAERLIQSNAPPIFSDLLCVKNRIRVRLKMVLLLEFLWLIFFTSKMLKSSNVHQNKNQTNQKLSSYWKLLLSWKISQNIHVSSRCVLRQEESYVKVLELIKNRDSRKRKLCKNWWFKFKLNTWLSETLRLWRKRKSEKLQRASKHIMCELNQNSWDMSIFGKSRTWLLCKMRIVHNLEDLRQFTRAGIKFHLKHKWRSKFESNKLTRTWTSYSRYDSSSCVLQQEDNYVMVLFPVAGTADISIDELRSVCKLLFGIFVLNLNTEQVRDWSFFGLLLQWKWHPPPQATSEFHQAHNDKPVFHL